MKNKKGISLIVLIVTIIVIIILAAAIILTISKNNPVESAREATFKSDIRNFQEDLAMYLSKQILKDYYGNRVKITTSDEPNLDEMKVYISSFTKKYEEKLGIEKDQLVYFANKVTELEEKWLDDLGIKPAGYVIVEAGKDCFIWDKTETIIKGYYEDKLKLYLEETNGVLKIPEYCKQIYTRAFYQDDLIEHLIFQDGIIELNAQAFRNCENLKSIYISNTVNSIYDLCFAECNNLVRIEVSEENQRYSSQDGVLYNKDKTQLIQAPGAIEICKIPETVTVIGEYSFSECKKLKEVNIPEGVISINAWAFNECNSLTNIKLPTTLINLEGNAFSSSGLEGTVIIPDNVTCIDIRTFRSCNYINKIIIGNKVETINGDYDSMREHAFEFCSSLVEFEVKEGNNHFSSQDGILYNKDKTKLILAPSGIKLNNISLPNNVKEIGEYAFGGCKNISGSLYIPEGVKSIGMQAFTECRSLTSITIPSSVTSIGHWAFSYCETLTINCRAESQPSGWDSDWNPLNRPVNWGYTGE